MNHKLTHLNLGIDIYRVIVECPDEFQFLQTESSFMLITHEEAIQKSFPKPLENYIDKMKNHKIFFLFDFIHISYVKKIAKNYCFDKKNIYICINFYDEDTEKY